MKGKQTFNNSSLSRIEENHDSSTSDPNKEVKVSFIKTNDKISNSKPVKLYFFMKIITHL